VPHVTLARGGSAAAARDLAAADVGTAPWTVSELVVWDARRREAAARIGLPA
jgi:hypothetical protein